MYRILFHIVGQVRETEENLYCSVYPVFSCMTETVIGLMGFPGAGKTTAMDNLTDRIDHSFHGMTMSDIAGTEYDSVSEVGVDQHFTNEFRQEAYDKDLYSSLAPSVDTDKADELGDWVDTVLTIDGHYFAERAVDYIEEEVDSEFVVIDGVRTTADVQVLKESNLNLELVFLSTPFSVRLDRMQDRGRGSDSDMEPDDLIYRDEQEMSWGVDEILLEEDVTHFYNNYESIGVFGAQFGFFVSDLLDL